MTLLNFLPLANQGVDESWGIAEAVGLRCIVILLEKISTPQSPKLLGHRHFRVLAVIFSLSLYVSAQFFERDGRVAPGNKALRFTAWRELELTKALKILGAHNCLTRQ
jgi:hypothetical protein